MNLFSELNSRRKKGENANNEIFSRDNFKTIVLSIAPNSHTDTYFGRAVNLDASFVKETEI